MALFPADRLQGRLHSLFVTSETSVRHLHRLIQQLDPFPLSQISQVMIALRGDLEQGFVSLTEADAARRDIQVLTERFGPQLASNDIVATIPLLSKPALDADEIKNYWNEGDICLLKGNTLHFSDALRERVNDNFLRKVFTHSVETDFSKVEAFDFGRYPHVTPHTPQLIFSHCPTIFTDWRDMDYRALLDPRFSDQKFVTATGEEFHVNSWFIALRCSELADRWEEMGQTPDTIFLPDNIDAATAQQVLNLIHCPYLIEKEKSPARLVEFLEIAGFLGVEFLLQAIDHEVALNTSSKVLQTHSPDTALEFVLGRKKLLDDTAVALPETRQAFSDLTKELACRSFPTELLEKAAPLTDAELSKFISIALQRYETLAPLLAYTDFSLLSHCFLQRQIFDVARPPQVRAQYLTLLETCVKYSPRDQLALTHLASCHQWSQHPERFAIAQQALQTLIQQNGAPQAKCALALLLYSEASDAAFELLEEALEHHPTHVYVYVTLAYLYSKSGHTERAISLLSQFTDPRPDVRALVMGDVRKIQLYYHFLKSRQAPDYKAHLPDFRDLMPQGSTFFEDALLCSLYPTLGTHFRANVNMLYSMQFECTFPLLKDILQNFCPSGIEWARKALE